VNDTLADTWERIESRIVSGRAKERSQERRRKGKARTN